MVTEKDKILDLISKEPRNISEIANAAQLSTRKVALILEQLSLDSDNIQLTAGKFKIVNHVSDDLTKNLSDHVETDNIRRRDYIKYSINGGEEVGKARLVLEIIKNVINDNPDGMSLKKLKEMFPDSLHKKFGVVQPLVEAIKRSEKHKRFFVDNPLKVGKQNIAVCREWSVDNIKPVINTAIGMGYDIRPSLQ